MNSLKENDKVNFGQQAGMRFASLTQMPPPNLYFAEILPNIPDVQVIKERGGTQTSEENPPSQDTGGHR